MMTNGIKRKRRPGLLTPPRAVLPASGGCGCQVSLMCWCATSYRTSPLRPPAFTYSPTVIPFLNNANRLKWPVPGTHGFSLTSRVILRASNFWTVVRGFAGAGFCAADAGRSSSASTVRPVCASRGVSSFELVSRPSSSLLVRVSSSFL